MLHLETPALLRATMKRKTKPEPTKLRAYSYLRFSTPEQSQGDSRRRQTDLAQRYAAAHDLELDDKLTFHDLGVSAYSGANVETGQLGAFLEAVRTKLVPPGSYLLVENLDRISRQGWWDAMPTLQAIINSGITLVTLQSGREYTADILRRNPMAGMEMQFELFRAKSESDTKGVRVGQAWAAKRARATTEPLTAKVPGWLVKVDHTIKLVPQRATVVRRIFEWTLKGIGQNSITERLNAGKVQTFGRATYWQRSYIAKILNNVAVIGTYIPHLLKREGTKRARKPLAPIANYYPAVVTKQTFARVQTLLRSHAPLRGRHATAGVVRNLFSGLARCPKCGGTMTRVYKGAPPKGGAYLACALAKTGGECEYHAVRYEPVETAFLRDAEHVLHDMPAGEEEGKHADSLEATLLYLEEQRAKLLGTIKKQGSSSKLVALLRKLEDQLASHRQAQDELLIERADMLGPVVERKVANLRAVLRRKPLDRAAANALLRQLFTGIAIEYTSHTQFLRLVWRQGGESTVIYGMQPVETTKKKRR